MARTATQTSTKAATRAANSKTKGANGESKPKRAPSAYNLFMKEQLKKWREANPSAPHKEGMGYVAKLWRDAPENPNRGKTNEKSKPVEDKENAQKKPRGKKSSPVVVEEEAENKEEEEADEAEDK